MTSDAPPEKRASTLEAMVSVVAHKRQGETFGTYSAGPAANFVDTASQAALCL